MEEKDIRKRAYSHFQSGFHCAEVISKTLLEKYSPESHGEVVRAASGFGGGIGGSTQELCGAYTGGVMTLGYLLGRKGPGDSLVDCGRLIQSFRDEFMDAFGAVECPTLLRRFPQEAKGIHCAKLTAEATVILTGIIESFEEETGKSIQAHFSQLRDQVQFSCNPFAATSCAAPDSAKSL